MLQEYTEVDEKYLEMCDDLTPYGVKIRYPQELFIEEYHVKKALEETRKLYDWLLTLLQTEKKDSEEWEKWVRVEKEYEQDKWKIALHSELVIVMAGDLGGGEKNPMEK